MRRTVKSLIGRGRASAGQYSQAEISSELDLGLNPSATLHRNTRWWLSFSRLIVDTRQPLHLPGEASFFPKFTYRGLSECLPGLARPARQLPIQVAVGVAHEQNPISVVEDDGGYPDEPTRPVHPATLVILGGGLATGRRRRCPRSLARPGSTGAVSKRRGRVRIRIDLAIEHLDLQPDTVPSAVLVHQRVCNWLDNEMNVPRDRVHV